MIKKIINEIKRRLDGELKYHRSQGVVFGDDCRLNGRIDFGSEPYLIEIGDHVSITKSTFVTHDGAIWVDRRNSPNIDLIAPIRIGSNVFIGYGAIILPGVVVGDDVVIGAGSIVTKSLESGGVFAGAPARRIASTRDYVEKNKAKAVQTKGMEPEDKKNYLLNRFLSDAEK